jgi:DNA-binding MarR family transcriptional regulator
MVVGRTRTHGARRLRTPAVLAWLRLMRVHQQVAHAAAEALKAHGLSGAQFDVLAHVGAAEGINQQQLAESLLVTKGNVCQLLDRMEQAGLLERRQEGRSNRVYLTAKGRALFAAVVPCHEQHIAGRFAALSPEEQAQLHGLLRKVDRSLRA